MSWSTVSSLATAGGTLVLAVATFASVRSANRSARLSERMLLAGLRPVLFPSRLEDPAQKVTWADRHHTHLPGGRGSVESADGVIYLAMSLRNVGAGIAVLHGWRAYGGWRPGDVPPARAEEFRRLSRDLYVPAGDVAFWQGAIREEDDPDRAPLEEAIAVPDRLTIDLLYGDHEGGQRTITRFGLTPTQSGEWLALVARHWNLDRADPR